MNRNVVVEPAQGGQVLRVMGPAVRPELDVMRFEPVPTGAPRNGAAAVTMGNEAPNGGWDCTRSR